MTLVNILFAQKYFVGIFMISLLQDYAWVCPCGNVFFKTVPPCLGHDLVFPTYRQPVGRANYYRLPLILSFTQSGGKCLSAVCVANKRFFSPSFLWQASSKLSINICIVVYLLISHWVIYLRKHTFGLWPHLSQSRKWLSSSSAIRMIVFSTKLEQKQYLTLGWHY